MSNVDSSWTSLAGSVYRSLIDDELARETDRKSSFESRGLQIVSSAGGIVTLLFALAAVVTNLKTFTPGGGTKDFLIVALVLFVAATCCGITANDPTRYGEPTVTSLRGLLTDGAWIGDVPSAQRQVAQMEITMIEEARRANNRKAWYLRIGLSLEILGVAAVAIAVLLILT